MACAFLLLGFHHNTQAQNSPDISHTINLPLATIESPDATAEKKALNSAKNTKKTLPTLPRIEIQACAFVAQYPKYQADCGTLFVKEDPNASHTLQNPARAVTIPFMILHPAGPAINEPVVITGGGGPGSSIYLIDNFDGDPAMFYSGLESSTLQNGRALIIMEMRGSGMSLANLDCPAITDLEIDLLTTYPYKWDNKRYLKTISSCAKRKKSQGIDANFYNTDYAVQDIDNLRKLLDFETWHLLGISHGSRISLRYAQQYPQHTASLILDSIYPFEVDAYAEMPQFNASIFTQPFTLCDTDPACRLENGEASVTLFESFMAQIQQNPPTLELDYYDENWTVGQKTLKISPELIAYVLVNNSYEGETALAFPQVIKDALKQDYAKLTTLVSNTIDLQNYTWFAEGAYASYACYEEIPFSNFALAVENARKYKFPYWDDLPSIERDQQLCAIWNIQPATNGIKKIDHSQLTLPVLILAGALDPFTPAIWAVDFHAKLPMRNKTQHLRVWPLKSHHLIYDDKCVESVVASFLNAPQNTINNDCALKVIGEATPVNNN